ncbi:Hypothetical protein SMAX5B_000043 [Scophthalmus maximus]|uniref:Uncharacterized protein n=1 Tax=Scophthalmus maximus TaxID=52904 RepID=A0A2U9D0Q2_SCOMX|nr:Hypothetical protein SMAX5B_000043 [Scophthalmus maximus]
MNQPSSGRGLSRLGGETGSDLIPRSCRSPAVRHRAQTRGHSHLRLPSDGNPQRLSPRARSDNGSERRRFSGFPAA